ncbi:MAG: bifunctional 23S rRNA (guanine(2069)-N(7))-methyltransferase RlmK/23S rRNA (guanine(2445)-N(2))-methyltransferase RlmL [Berryella intestinalis]|uniref:bifunctional 23S rRNA (guanine(2069)-N(7))-methyltransferase RlmK/23S rRNA (guanine(2445)-N(2))-methyltransferase RlmL n=1 Tax=Berryella intestinalis TaxID=1531429 RepID=UPI002A757DC4|nr:bifunctional 23S rRNA (guanine(2069)-N(7))-methyltransferase RlmK/23S rRNA (guanine(2445)-N(2))-methyltransferase RlmL [Berryella intestinalis]MDY3128891.1 bifunctional 23S rRNA (guanine(2069)-N(7))-methyltransferase RlmK/23S rRNA (guanine(2445)-N(2))-methyltransferase RlmL [Berryella intestinalis]
MTQQLELFASCLSGMEGQLAEELKTFRIRKVRPLAGGVAFFCDLEAAYRACLWSRLAARVMLVLDRVSAADADALYAGAHGIAWEDIVSSEASVAVHASGANEQLRNTRFTSLKVKDAVADRLRAFAPERAQAPERPRRVAIDVRIRNDKATISLDLAGGALGTRSYFSDDDTDDAALEALLAAGLLAQASWAERAAEGFGFVDPVCGNGVLLTEAVSVACDRAAGLGRERWGFAGWKGHDEALWGKLVREAERRFEEGLSRIAGADALAAGQTARPDTTRVRFVGAAASSPAISRARDHIRRAGLRPAASVELGDAESVVPLVRRVSAIANRYAAADAAGLLVAGNPEARAAGKRASLQAAEIAFVNACATAPEGSVFALAGGAGAVARFKSRAVSSQRVGRDRIETILRVFDTAPDAGVTIEIPDSSGGAPRKVQVYDEGSIQFASRLRKVLKERRKWAAAEDVSCYRVYDADLPEYAVAIDVYEGCGEARGNTYLHVSEYAAPSSVDPEKARHRFADALSIAAVVCGVRPDHVFAKTRMRDKGGSQYRDAGDRPYVTTIEEGGYTFEVDLNGRLDTGIFLDHRITRSLVGKRAQDARFLNLFAYTGTATVYAAGGGARSTVTVDLSQTYLEWADRNMLANGFDGSEHSFERGDVMRWLTDARRSGRRFDVIFVDPPTFSNSKSMGKRTWDVQRDHVELLINVTRLLSEEGEAIFSCNLRSFKPDLEKLERYGVALEDVSASTIPADFARTPKIHKCYIVTRA